MTLFMELSLSSQMDRAGWRRLLWFLPVSMERFCLV